jgi:hypothetical protein
MKRCSEPMGMSNQLGSIAEPTIRALGVQEIQFHKLMPIYQL